MSGPMLLDAPNFGGAALVDLPADRSAGESWDPYRPTDQQTDAIHAIVSTSAEQVRLAGTTSSRLEALAQAADNRIETVRRVTGDTLENPYRNGYAVEARARIAAGRWDQAHAAAEGRDMPEAIGVAQHQVDIFNERIDAIAQKNPDKAPALNFYQPLAAQAGAIASNAEDAAAVAQQRARDLHLDGGTIFANTLIGSMWGARRDPLTLASLAFGPTAASGRTALARVASSATAQGLFNVGLDVIQHPAVEQWRRDRGREPGSMLPSPGEVGMAFALGAIPGAGFGAIAEAARPAARVIAAGERSIAADRLVLDERPPGVAPELHDHAAAQAVMHVSDPVNEPPGPLPRVFPGLSELQLADVARWLPKFSDEAAAVRGRLDQAATKVITRQKAAEELGQAAATLRGEADSLRADLAAVDEKIAAVMPATDPATEARLGAIASDLAAPALTAPRRAALETERTSIAETLQATTPKNERLLASLTQERQGLARALDRQDKAHARAQAAADNAASRVSNEQARIASERQANEALLVSKREIITNELRRSISRLAREGYGIDLPRTDAEFHAGLISLASREELPGILSGVTGDLHQRAEAARRISDAPAADAVRAAPDRAAAVEALRADPKLIESALASPRADLQGAGHLASLSEEAWRGVRDGTIDPQHAILASEYGVPPERQLSVLEHVRDLGPRDPKEAALMMADVIEGQGAPTRAGLAALEQAAAPSLPSPAKAGEGAPARSEGPRDLVPYVRDDGTPVLVKPEVAAAAGERQGLIADLVRSCK